MLKDMIGKQTIHRIFDISEWRLDVGKKRGDVIGSQARSYPTGDFLLGSRCDDKTFRDIPC